MKPLPTYVLFALLCAGLAACSGGESAVAPETAEALAAKADRVAELIESGDGCAALQEVDALARSARQAEESGNLSSPVGAEVVSTAEALRGTISCSPEEPTPAEEAPAEEPPDEEPPDEAGPPADAGPPEDQQRDKKEEQQKDKEEGRDDEGEDD